MSLLYSASLTLACSWRFGPVKSAPYLPSGQNVAMEPFQSRLSRVESRDYRISKLTSAAGWAKAD